MAAITVTHLTGSTYRVRVDEGGTQSVHEVVVSPEAVDRYAPGATAERLVEASFEFLLQRESKESILRRFDLPVIERYFPEYRGEIGTRC
jgi:hypothetical protein